MPRIVYWKRLPLSVAAVIAQLRAEPDVELVECATLDECVNALPGADGLVLYNAAPELAKTLVAAIHALAPRLKWMHFLTAGREGFDGLELPARIRVSGAVGASSPVVAEHAMALLLALGRALPATLQQQAQTRWDRGIARQMRSLEGQTLLIVGMGPIGNEIARRARGFAMHTIGINRDGRPLPGVDRCLPLSELHGALGMADVTALAISLSAQTRGMLDAAAFAACKPGMLLVNVARGALIDTPALIAALRSGQVAGAGLDVLSREPLPADDPLWKAPNLIITPHVAVDGSPATDQRIAVGVLAALRDVWPAEAH